ncbi:hypothetical protein [Prochlorococcus sp. MIT 1223]|uniref:hypothetical protein n=1 Tax=Prochlorococcus sp. MIT 1223 TaxID=3096217 RepID=UPI002A75DB13|nr:hypothetical protein [Prochlorococcus sp. MIT 1223]|tara:strand:- start:141 stop:407 length:267 start_codon:yes stop_codon:yes gene_type:complete
MGYIIALTIALLSSNSLSQAQSTLLESVKRNPKEAIALCSKFKALNAKGISASSKESILSISRKRNLSSIDAEIISMYVRGLHCPDVV